MTVDAYSGDLGIYLGVDGAECYISGGQPLLDRGIETAALISLLTDDGWCGNAIGEDGGAGSDFVSVSSGTITRTALNDARGAAERALEWMIEDGIASSIDVDISNPSGVRIDVKISIHPPGSSAVEISLTKYGLLWQSQATEPYSGKVQR